MDHFFLDDVTLFHMMDVASRFSVAHAVITTSLDEAIYAFEALRISQFWPPNSVHADGAFHHDSFKALLNKYDINRVPYRLQATPRTWSNLDMAL